MKIAIVTVYDSFVNYGSYLQAYGTKCFLEEQGHEVFFIRRMSDDAIFERLNNIARINHTVPKGKSLRLLRQLKKNFECRKELKYNSLRLEASKQDWKELKIIDKEDLLSIGIDCVICGSDEIWNVHNKDVDLNFYTCGWIKGIPLIAYAISSGGAKSDELGEISKNSIMKFDKIFPRDENTERLVREIGKETEEIVCDPTILLGKKSFSKIANKINKYGKYMLVYSYVYTKKQKKMLRRYADERGLKIITPCITADFADEIIFTSALEFPALIKNAECMFTATFHGTIFGLMFANKFCCIPRVDKIKSLLIHCKSEKFGVDEDCTYEEMKERLEMPIDHNFIDTALDELREKSKNKLVDALERITYE